MNSIGNFVTMQCSAGRLGVLAFKWMTLDPHHPPKHCHRPSSPPHGNSTGLPLRTQATTTTTNLLGVVVVTMQASVITYAGGSFPQKHEKWTAIISNNHAVKSWSRQFISVWLSTASSSIDSAQRLWCTSYSGLDIVVVCRAVSEAKDTSTCDVSGQRTEMHL